MPEAGAAQAARQPTPPGGTASSRRCSSPKRHGPIERPDWFPQGPELDEWADLVAHPRENSEKLKELGFDMDSLAGMRAAGGGAEQGAGY